MVEFLDYSLQSTLGSKNKPELASRKGELKVTFQEIGFQADNPQLLSYPAGGSDIAPLFIPSARVLSILDAAPFFSLRRGDYPYIRTIESLLDNNINHYVGLPEIYSVLQREGKQGYLSDATFLAAQDATQDLYEDGYRSLKGRAAKKGLSDQFAQIIGTAIAMDVDLRGMKLGKSQDGSYNFSLPINGREKHVIYNNLWLDSGFLRRTSRGFQLLQNSFGEATGGKRTAVIVKADVDAVSPFVLPAINPDRVIGVPSTALSQIMSSNQFTFQPLRTPTYPDLKWGYKNVRDIQIGKKNR